MHSKPNDWHGEIAHHHQPSKMVGVLLSLVSLAKCLSSHLLNSPQLKLRANSGKTCEGTKGLAENQRRLKHPCFHILFVVR